MDAAKLEQNLGAAIHDGTLKIRPVQPGLESWWQVIGKAVPANGITLTNCRLTEGAPFAIVGETVDFGHGKILLTLGFADSQNGVKITTGLQFDRTLSLPAIPWLSADNISVRLVVDGDQQSGSLLGTAHIGNLSLPVKLDLPRCEDSWVFSIGGVREPIAVDTTLITTMLNGDLSFLPPGLEEFISGFRLYGLRINFNPVDKSNPITWISVSAALKADQPWEIIPGGLQLYGLTSEVAAHPAKNGARPTTNPTIVAVIQAKAKVAGTREVDVRLSQNTQQGLTLLELSAVDNVRFPGLQSLADLSGHPALFQVLLSFVSQFSKPFSDLYLRRCEFALDNKNLRLVQLRMDVECYAPIVLARNVNLEHVTLELRVTPDASTSVRANMTAQIAAGEQNIMLRGRVDNDIELKGRIASVSLSQLAGIFFPGLPDGFPDPQFSHVLVSLKTRGSVDLSAGAQLFMHSLASGLKIPLPDSLNNIELDIFSGTADVFNKTYGFNLESNTVIPLFDGDAAGVEIVRTSVAVTMSKGSRVDVDISLVLRGAATIAGQLSVSFDNVTLSYHSATGEWSSDSAVFANIKGHDKPYELSVEMANDKFALLYKGTIQFASLSYGGLVSCELFSIFISPKNSKSSTERKSGDYAWGIGGDIKLRQPDTTGKPWLDLTGKLLLEKAGAENKLTVSVDAPNIPGIPLNMGGAFPRAPELKLRLDQFDLGYATATAKEARSGWAVTAKTVLQIVNIPDLLAHYLPVEELHGQLSITGDTLKLAFDVPSTLQPHWPRMALKFASDVQIDLGQPVIDIVSIDIELGSEVQLVQRLHITLPQQINCLFGTTEEGKPKKRLFNESFDLQLSAGNKLSLNILTSPLADLAFITKTINAEEQLWTNWDFGDVGRFEFRVPEFEYSKTRWKASGGFNRLSETRIPLAPIKYLLGKSGVPPALLSALPDGIPLVDIDFRDDSFNGQLDKLLGSLFSKQNPEIKQALDLVRQTVQALPEHLQEYFQIKIPDSLVLDISVDSLGGGCSGGLRILDENANENRTESAGQQKPLKLLFPFMGVPPGLIGLTIRGMAFGQKSAGAMITIDFDGYIDRFNLVELPFAVTLQDKKIANRVHLDNSRFLVPSGLPVPIPLFYDRIEYNYRDVLGTQLQTSWNNKEPDWGVSDYIKVFQALVSFFGQKLYLFSEHNFDQMLNMRLGIGMQRLTMPAFLGSGHIVLNTRNVELNTGRMIGGIFDFFKTGNPQYAIQSIPLKASDSVWIRLGNINLNFGPILDIKANWCITTQQEFEQQVLPAIATNKQLAKALTNDVLTSLPETQHKIPFYKGFIIIMGSCIDLGGLLGLHVQFAMCLSGHREKKDRPVDSNRNMGSFETGFLLSGTLANTLELRLGGRVGVSHQTNGDEKVEIEGALQVLWQNRNLVRTHGMIAVSKYQFDVDITLELTDIFSIAGHMEMGRQKFYMSGDVSWGHTGTAHSYKGSVEINNQGVVIGVSWHFHGMDGTVTVQTPGRENALYTATAMLKPDEQLMVDFKKLMQAAVADIAGSSVDQVYKSMQNAINDFNNTEISVRGLRDSLPRLCDSIVKTINATIINNTGGVKKVARSTALSKAKPFIDRVNRISQVARKSSDSRFRDDLRNALQDIVDHNKLNISITLGKGLFKKKFTIYSGRPLTSDNINRLQQAIDNIDHLQQSSNIRASNVKEYAKFSPRDQLLAEINNAASKALPDVKSISFEVPLDQVIPSNVNVSIDYLYNGKVRNSGDVKIDFSNPAALAKNLVDAVR